MAPRAAGQEEGGRKPIIVGGGDDDVIAKASSREPYSRDLPHCHPVWPKGEFDFCCKGLSWNVKSIVAAVQQPVYKAALATAD